jgi:hypothetical protein
MKKPPGKPPSKRTTRVTPMSGNAPVTLKSESTAILSRAGETAAEHFLRAYQATAELCDLIYLRAKAAGLLDFIVNVVVYLPGGRPPEHVVIVAADDRLANYRRLREGHPGEYATRALAHPQPEGRYAVLIMSLEHGHYAFGRDDPESPPSREASNGQPDLTLFTGE